MKRFITILAAAFVFLAGTPTFASEPMLRNFAGEQCRLASPLSVGATSIVLCGAGDRAGAVQMTSHPALPATSQRMDLLWAAASQLRAESGEPAICGAPRWIGQHDTLALGLCTVSGNGWPEIVVAGSGDGRLYEAHGLPSSLPVLVHVISAALGGADEAGALRDGAALLDAQLPAALRNASASAAGRYRADIEVGRLDSGAQDYAGAEAAYRRALSAETALLGENALPVAQTVLELALQVSNQGRFSEAEGLFQRATPTLESATEASLRIRLYSYLALHAANQRKFADALKLARQAASEARADLAAHGGEAGDPEGQAELAHSLRLEADMALRLGDLASARAAGDEALWIVLEQPGLPLWWRPDILELVGDIDAASGKVVQAEHNLAAAVRLDQTLFGDSARTAAAELHLAAFYAGQELYSAAMDAGQRGLAMLEGSKLARANLMPDQLLPYFRAASAADSKADPQTIFAAAQLINGGVRDATILHMAARNAAATPALASAIKAAQDAEQAVTTARLNLAAEQSKADADRSAERLRALQTEFDTASSRYGSLTKALYVKFPAYARLASPELASLSAVEAALPVDQALINFIVGHNGAYAVLVRHDGLTLRALPVTSSSLAGDVAELRTSILPRPGHAPGFNDPLAHALYQKLLQPISDKLEGVKSLVVVPSPELASLPMSLLETTAQPRSFLIRHYAVAEVPSVRAFVALAAMNLVAAPKPVLALGAPDFSGSSSRAFESLASACLGTRPVAPDLIRALPPLPDTAGEVRAVVKDLGGTARDVLTGDAASESGLRAHDLSQYRVLYFATHGLLPGELHCESEPGLALSAPLKPHSAADDGLLTASEVAALNLNAELVVLSACNTAASGDGGSALDGLADAFFQAGAHAVLATEWEIPSAATVQLMTAMFADQAAIHAGSWADALRQAQLAVMEQPRTAEPYFWAAFTLFGYTSVASMNTAEAKR